MPSMSARDHLSKYQFGEPDLDPHLGMIEARTAARGAYVGHILWNREQGPNQNTGAVTHIYVAPRHRRKGVATEMYNRAKAVDPNVKHANVRTKKGDAWAASTGDPLPKNMAWPGT